MVICFISLNNYVRVGSPYSILDLNKNPKVTKVEIVNALSIKMQIPEIYHSRVVSGSLCAMSLSARNSMIKAITERNPRIAVIVAIILKIFIITLF
jgi:hypothetical protein